MSQSYFSNNNSFLSLFQGFSSLSKQAEFDMPIRLELLNREGLIELAKSLSDEHKNNISKFGTNNLYKRFQDNQKLINYAYSHFCDYARQKEKLPIGAEWLLDNYYIISEQIKETKEYLPKGYYKTLPKLKTTEFKGLPRIYHIAITYISRTDALLNEESLADFIISYQQETELTIGEIWAIPIMLRLALIENLRRSIQAIWQIQNEKELAKEIVEQVITSDKISGTDILLGLAEKIKSYPNILKLGVIYLAKELNVYGTKTLLAQQWIEEKFKEQNQDPQELNNLEQFIQAANQITISNTVSSLRNMGAADWHEWFEKVSLVDEVLRKDPNNIFSNSDFITRNNCRNQIEKISKKSKFSEVTITKKLFEFYDNLNQSERDSHQKLLLYYLIGEGRFEFFKYIKFKPPFVEKLRNSIRKRIVNVYLFTIWFPTVISAILCFIFISNFNSNLYLNLLFAILSVFPFSEFFIQLTHWSLAFLVRPKYIPKLDSEKALNSDQKTSVIINTILKSNIAIEAAISELEVKYLVNKDPLLNFVILADFTESKTLQLPDDESLVAYAKRRIQQLNRKYFNTTNPQFFIFFRKRTFSTSENIYMGWERKRGKVVEFNRFLLEGNIGNFIIAEDEKEYFENTNYVITLDADTILPANSAKKLISTISHPLNLPIIDKKNNIVTKGYTLIQPLMQNSLASINVSRFSQIISTDTGIDAYSSLVSEVYQDLFSEGTFIGKGIYNVRYFEQVLSDKIPENSLLSHDLFEGNFVRAGLATDIVLIENIPSKYNVELSRLHRWARGDWQLIPWLARKMPSASGEKILNYLRPLGQWKITDNLRRSLLYPIILLQILILFYFNLQINFYLFLIPIGFLLIPILTTLLDVFKLPCNKKFLPLISNHSLALKKCLVKFLISVIFLPKMAELMVNAILKTLYRVYISKKNLLEWLPADIAEKNLKNTLPTYLYFMLPCVLVSLTIFITVPYIQESVYYIAILLGITWFISPFVAYFISRPLPVHKYRPSPKEKEILLDVANRTWLYFDDHLNQKNNFLIPDNLQTVPENRIANRTSPTNIGLSLLSVVSSYDLGFITLPYCLSRLSKTITTIKKLEKFSGHLFNWYDTISLEPLAPRYISFVDSSNFTAYCLALKQTCKEFFNSPLIKSTYLFDKKQNILNFTSLNESSEKLDELRFKAKIQNLIPWYNNLLHLKNNFSKDLPETVREKLNGTFAILDTKEPTLTLTKKINNRIIELATEYQSKIIENLELKDLIDALLTQALESNEQIDHLANRIRDLISDLNNLINETDYRFLYNKERNTFSIGYMLENASADESFYDLLASEARLGSLTTIALGQVPIKHWFYLGRKLSSTGFGKALYSWTGTMFEYLLPNLLTKHYQNTLLTESNVSAIKAQIGYAKIHKTPWGISESAHAGVDFEQTYQYRAFGVPDLGLKRGLGSDYVISPYSSLLALPFLPKAVLKNIKNLFKYDSYGKYGFYEALDFTTERLGADEAYHPVKTFFAHHQGMILCSINNFLNEFIFQDRFHSEPRIKSVELLLHEKFPITNAEIIETKESPAGFYTDDESEEGKTYRQFYTPHTIVPQTQLISNGNYTVLIENAGSGKSFLKNDYLINTWKEDINNNTYGNFIYLKDLDSNQIWSNTYQPTLKEPDFYEVTYSPDKVDFKRIDHNITCLTEITVSPEHNLELRQLNITNLSSKKRELQVTSFAEVAMANQRAFNSHPAFLRTFIKSQFIEELDTLIFTRRPRSSQEKETYIFHQLSMPVCWDKTYFETDRREFIGRYNNLQYPLALKNATLKNTSGSILDPAMSLQTKVEINPGFSAHLTFITGYAENIEEVYNLIRLFHTQQAITRTFDLAWSKSNIEIRNENFSIAQTHRFQKLANAIFYNYPGLSPSSEFIKKNKLPQSGLWRLGISGDLPIVLLTINNPEQIDNLKDLLLAHEYLRRRGLRFDLVVINEYQSGYFREFQLRLEELILMSPSGQFYDTNGGIFLRDKQQITGDEQILLQAVAKVYINSNNGNLKDHISKQTKVFLPYSGKNKNLNINQPYNRHETFSNFLNNSKTFQIKTNRKTLPPLPWSNVIANPNFGTLVTEAGGGYTWSENSRENRLTSWSNDPITDAVSEAIYIRNTSSENFWSLTPLPSPHTHGYTIEHNFGYSRFVTNNENIESDLNIFVSKDKKIKFNQLTVKNNDFYDKSLEIYLYIDLVLGVIRDETARYIQTGYLTTPEFVYAQNFYNNEFSGRYVYAACSEQINSFSCNKTEFIGRNRSLANPLFLEKLGSINVKLANLMPNSKSANYLSGNFGVGFDSAFILKTNIQIPARESKTLTFFIGEENTIENVKEKVTYLKRSNTPSNEFQEIANFWKTITNKIQITTPTKTFNQIMNGWLIYQNLSCRMFGRSGFYQSGGAIGFRDQLQDSLSMIYFDPEITKQQIILHSQHQFLEGDVQHWWHPPSGRGTRTKISDDLLWMPYVVLNYLEKTGDRSILYEKTKYLNAQTLTSEQHDLYLQPDISETEESILEHCIRAIDYSLKYGEHNLPLIKGGDWNDGMDEVGKDGKGESVWLAWFLADILNKFSELLKDHYPDKSEIYKNDSKKIVESIEQFAWDGNWYLRAFYDDGTPLGSVESDECKIDSLSQTWSIITGLGNQERSKTALENVHKRLVDKDKRIIKLLTPPFDQTKKSPGYIKSYIPGVRENGAQYTHAATWVILATALQGQGNKAFELFQLINPIDTCQTVEGINQYQGEPYVVCGDVLSNDQHPGRAGWSWYTGSAAWLYRIALENIIGFKISPEGIVLDPCIPADWKDYEITYQHQEKKINIKIENPNNLEKGNIKISFNGEQLEKNIIPYKLIEEQEEHSIEFVAVIIL